MLRTIRTLVINDGKGHGRKRSNPNFKAIFTVFSGEIKDHGKPVIIACFRAEFWTHDFLIRSSTLIRWTAQSMSVVRSSYDSHLHPFFTFLIHDLLDTISICCHIHFCILHINNIINHQVRDCTTLTYLRLIICCNRNHNSGIHVNKNIRFSAAPSIWRNVTCTS